MRFGLLIAATLSLLAAALEMPAMDKIPSNWQLANENLDETKEITMKIALVPKNAELLEKKLLEIATPGNPNFRKYLKQKQIADIVARSPEEIKRVDEWLQSSGAKVVDVHPHGDWVTATTTIANAEKLFNCKLVQYVNTKTEQTKLGAKGSYTIPDAITDVVQFVSGMTSFSFGHWSAFQHVQADTSAKITPQTVYDVYEVPVTGSHNTKLGSQAVVEFGSSANFNDNDLQVFFKDYQQTLTGETCGVVYGSNDGSSSHPSMEANLDVQYIMATGTFVNTTDYKITGSRGENIEDQFLDYTQIVNSQIDPPLVHSISYGEYGGSYDNTTDQRFSYELQKMGISGISVLLASGDNGVGCNSKGTSLEYDYPSSPYLTMVGATYIDTNSKKEIGATLSSGGFSEDFWMASWQADAVNAYLNSGIKLPSQTFNKNGRAYPDVAAFGQNVQIVSNGKQSAVSGTSCSAPIFAGVVAQLNHELLSRGKAPLGFLNPWLYANPQMFTDITQGSNPYEKCDGFLAAPGWDPVTGLGTPLYSKMYTAALNA